MAVALMLLVLLTAALATLQKFADIGTVTIIYLIAVLYAATQGGVLPAVVTALAAIGAAAFFFYAPIYDFRVYSPVHLIDLILFIIVAVVTGKLATDARKAKMREEAEALREALIGSVSHELRSPLSSIIGFASTLTQLREIASKPKILHLVQGMLEEAERLNDRIQDLLDSTRISSEGVRPHREWADPADIINSVIEKRRRVLAGHAISVAVANDLPLVHTDPMLVEKALGHIVENAAKYSPPGSQITIAANLRDGALSLSVTDSGVGIARDERRLIWERFYRSPRHRNTAGSGLGLWIARALVEACNGRTEVTSSDIGLGTTVSIHLPLQPTLNMPEPD